MIHENLEEIYAKKIQKQNQEKLKKQEYYIPTGVFKVLDWKKKSTGS